MDLNLRVNIELDEATNYLPMGFWDADVEYSITDLGIPFVKVKSSSAPTNIGFFVFALRKTDGFSKGVNPLTNNNVGDDWRLLESAEFIYMQEAYIERLQAVLITAEKIESLMLRTGNIEVLEGAKIAGLNIYNNAIASYPELGGIVPPGEHIYISRTGVSVDRSVGMSQNQVITGLRTTHDGIRVFKSDSAGNKSIEIRIDGIYRNGAKIL